MHGSTSICSFPAAGQPHLLPLLPQARIMPGVVHRPQVKLNNNVVTLSNVQNPAVYSSPAPQPPEIQPPKPPPVDICSVTAMSPTESKGGTTGTGQRESSSCGLLCYTLLALLHFSFSVTLFFLCYTWPSLLHFSFSVALGFLCYTWLPLLHLSISVFYVFMYRSKLAETAINANAKRGQDKESQTRAR